MIFTDTMRRIAFFRCNACSHTVTVEIDRGKIAEPDRCPRDVCNLQGSMLLVHNRCEFADRQIVRLQETPGKSLLEANPLSEE